MGMFDYIRYNDHQYQTKHTSRQFMDQYEIRGDELWVEEYDSEWVETPESLFGGYLDKKNIRWRFCKEFEGVIRFYREDIENGGHKHNAWIEYSALFMDGKMIRIREIKS